MESMNEDANTVKEPSNSSLIWLLQQRLSFIYFDAGIYRNVGSCLHKTYLFFKISGILEEVVMQSTFLAGSFWRLGLC